jgi:formylglycine-generating enzyme required for sulfatase activity/uncharacterized Tic20 family protein
MIRVKKFAYNPSEHEAERASGSYLMSLVAIIVGLPLPIINLIATLIFYLGNRNSTYFVRWHCTQALLSQLSMFLINSFAFGWTISIIFTDDTFDSSYFAYIIIAIIFNFTEFIVTIYTAVQTRKGIHVEWWFYGVLTSVVCGPGSRSEIELVKTGLKQPAEEHRSAFFNNAEKSERRAKSGRWLGIVAAVSVMLAFVGYILYNLLGTSPMESGIAIPEAEHEISRTKEEIAPAPTDDNRQRQPASEPIPDAIYKDPIAGTFILVQGGSFNMGCTSEQRNCNSNEKPVHRVTLESYYIGKYEVTQAQWQEVMGENPSRFSGCDQCPVERVSWIDIQEFLRRLNARTGLNFRLPTEAEWEFAARGGNKSQGYLYAGSDNLETVGWYSDNANKKTKPVGQKAPNELGLHDMSGNIYEMCQDFGGLYSSSVQKNPTGPPTGSHRIGRGGSWLDDSQRSRIAHRANSLPHNIHSTKGFRLVMNPSATSSASNSAHVSNQAPPATNLQSLTSNFVLVRGGSFIMGCTSEQRGCFEIEKPVHRVTVGSYYLSRYEVTQAQWREVMGNNPSEFWGCEQCPVEQVDWNDIQEFLLRLNDITGQNYRLPTEAEWEFAARGGNRSQGYQYAGSDNIDEVAWYEENADDRVQPVGLKLPNELGLYDMSGNVLEWCQNWAYDYSASTQNNSTEGVTGSYHMLRGGSWKHSKNMCRVAFRMPDATSPLGLRFSSFGFRLARTP